MTPFFQKQKGGTWGEANVLTFAVAKVANLGVGRSLGPNRRGKIGAEPDDVHWGFKFRQTVRYDHSQ